MVIAFGNRYIGKMQAIQAKSQAIAEFALTIKPLCKNRRFRLIQIRFEFLALINCLLCKRLNMFYPEFQISMGKSFFVYAFGNQ